VLHDNIDKKESHLLDAVCPLLNEALRAHFAAGYAFLSRVKVTVNSRSQLVTLKRGQNIKYLPFAFTEHGALMAANILNSPRAVAMSVYVIRAFVKMREDQAANAAILKRLAEIDKTLLLHDAALREIFENLRPLLAPPPAAPKPEIGFHVKEEPIPYRVRRKARAHNAG
jgi:hypothetical protein